MDSLGTYLKKKPSNQETDFDKFQNFPTQLGIFTSKLI